MTIERTALLIDDAPMVLAAMTRILRRAGFAVTSFTSAIPALDMIETGRRFHVVVCDVHMPELDGFAFRRRALQLWPDLDSALVFVTGADLSTVAAGSEGVTVFTKPVDETFHEFLRSKNHAAT